MDSDVRNARESMKIIVILLAMCVHLRASDGVLIAMSIADKGAVLLLNRAMSPMALYVETDQRGRECFRANAQSVFKSRQAVNGISVQNLDRIAINFTNPPASIRYFPVTTGVAFLTSDQVVSLNDFPWILDGGVDAQGDWNKVIAIATDIDLAEKNLYSDLVDPGVANKLDWGGKIRASITKYTKDGLVILPVVEPYSGNADDVTSELEKARFLTSKQKFEEALRIHVWMHRTAVGGDRRLRSVAMTFGLSQWADLASHFPKALSMLLNARDEMCARIIRDKEFDKGDILAIISVNSRFSDDASTVEMVRGFPLNKREILSGCMAELIPILAARHAYDLVNVILRDNDAVISNVNSTD